MKNEDIEKAAVNYDSRVVPFRAFVAGAQWRIIIMGLWNL